MVTAGLRIQLNQKKEPNLQILMQDSCPDGK